ncbi:MAG TPA: GreA/GreB family elongation factor [Oxalicibacterium sp.]|uniref:GreA/GreB family elongation factor n=1 Tax=Oxalicibacterium sp. TaxID=2766525 RepID=UPI002BFE6DB3|nr:GreA/GreB family elongation factor [Oxalicibacterium sp.]HWU97824.1 GreA/GreB family elongation factor [Oxalicibacterium sp.]
MNKAFVKESGDDDAPVPMPDMPDGVKNYITPAGHRRLEGELRKLLAERLAQQDAVSDGDARQRDQRVQYLQTRLDAADVVDPALHVGNDQVFFGAMVTYEHADGERQTITIVGLDELDPAHGLISWLSPVAQSLLGAEVGDVVMLEGPAGDEELTIIDVRYPSPEN